MVTLPPIASNSCLFAGPPPFLLRSSRLCARPPSCKSCQSCPNSPPPPIFLPPFFCHQNPKKNSGNVKVTCSLDDPLIFRPSGGPVRTGPFVRQSSLATHSPSTIYANRRPKTTCSIFTNFFETPFFTPKRPVRDLFDFAKNIENSLHNPLILRNLHKQGTCSLVLQIAAELGFRGLFDFARKKVAYYKKSRHFPKTLRSNDLR